MQSNSRDNGNSGKRPGWTQQHFTQEFKLEPMRLAEGGGRSLNEIAADLRMRPNVLRQWRRQAEARADPLRSSFPGKGGSPAKMRRCSGSCARWRG